jgi:copper resistance protein D
MGEWPDIALRFADYLSLMVLFGVPLFATYALGSGEETSRVARHCAALAALAAVAAAVLSLFGLAAMAMQMTGESDPSTITSHVVEMIVTRTGAGIAWVVRMMALALCLVAVPALRRRPATRLVVLACGGAVALASLAWTGHGAMDEGARGYLHLLSDVLHLLAAGAWVGALLAFVVLSVGPGRADGRSVETLNRTASGFAGVGTTIVATLVVTGVINYILIVGPTLRALFTTVYGRLLGAKLLLFAGMLGLAAANRYVFSPRLEAALRVANFGRAAGMLRRSLWTETGLVFLVVALVAWLGLLAPDT